MNVDNIKAELVSEEDFECENNSFSFEIKEESEDIFGICFTKCGEIFLGGKGEFLLTCTFCDEQLNKLEEFKHHVENMHLHGGSDKLDAQIKNESEFVHDSNQPSYLTDKPDADLHLDTLEEEEDEDEEEPKELSETECDRNPSANNKTETQDFLEYFHNFVKERSKRKSTEKSVEATGSESYVADNLSEDDICFDGTDSENSSQGKASDVTGKISQNDSNIQGGYCSICDRHFRLTANYLKHKLRHEIVSDPEDDFADNFTETSPKETFKATNDAKPRVSSLKCRHCGKQFRDKDRRIFHERTHTGEEPYACPFCPKRFRAQRFRDIHARIHSEERPYKCTFCPHAFKHKMNLTVHIRSHLGEKRFECEFCGKKFVRNVDCRVHMRSHTGEKPFQCEECGQRFTTSSKLLEHRKRHTNDRPYECEICFKRFYSKGLLKNHEVVHSDERPFQCDVCFETFPRKRALLSHIKIHSDVKEYVCKLCDKEFAQNAGLYCHMRTHGIAKPSKTAITET